MKKPHRDYHPERDAIDKGKEAIIQMMGILDRQEKPQRERAAYTIYYPHFSHMFGDPVTGLFLSHLLAWFGKGDDPHYVYKSAPEWERETGITKKQQQRCRRVLKEAGVLHEKVTGGVPKTVHYRLDLDRLTHLVRQYTEDMTAGLKWTFPRRDSVDNNVSVHRYS